MDMAYEAISILAKSGSAFETPLRVRILGWAGAKKWVASSRRLFGFSFGRGGDERCFGDDDLGHAVFLAEAPSCQ
jgi:hypothetical protein